MRRVDLNEIQIFLKVVQAGSFTRAAALMGMPNSTVSARITSLEKRLGTTLLQRTTRRLSLTQIGRDYFDHCLSGIEEISQAENLILAKQAEPVGDLRITAPVFLGSELLPEVLAECRARFPGINVEVILKDRAMDLVHERIDLALRAGDLDDSSMIVKKLGSVGFAAYSSPKYLKEAGEIRHPKDLAHLSCIQFTPLGKGSWRFTNGKSWLSVPLPGRLVVDQIHLAMSLAIRGTGITLLPDFLCRTEKGKGRLVRVLPGWRSEARSLQFIHPPQRFPSPKLRSFLEIAVGSIQRQIAG